MDHSRLACILPEAALHELAASWLKEDIPTFDYAAFTLTPSQRSAALYSKAVGTLAGVPFFNAVFSLLDCTVEWKVQEGHQLPPGKTLVAVVRGNVSRILIGERVALNVIARASGIATVATKLNSLAKAHNYTGIIAATRKTTPGFRLVEKYACLVGNVDTHRMDLSSMVMLKDNHINSCGGVRKAVRDAKMVAGFAVKVEVECGCEESARAAIDSGADIVMLDNFGADEIKVVAKRLKETYGNRVLIECSGGLTTENCVDYFSEYLDILSFGSLTQGVPHVDFSLKIVPE